MAAADVDNDISRFQGLTDDRDASVKLSLRLSALEGDLQQQVQRLTQGADQLKVGAPRHATVFEDGFASEQVASDVRVNVPLSRTRQKQRLSRSTALLRSLASFISLRSMHHRRLSQQARFLLAHFEKLL
jgi:hypothetical protein